MLGLSTLCSWLCFFKTTIIKLPKMFKIPLWHVFICLSTDRESQLVNTYLENENYISVLFKEFSFPSVIAHTFTDSIWSRNLWTRKCGWTDKQPYWKCSRDLTLYTAGQGFSGLDVINARSSLNHSWDLYLWAMTPAWAERTLRPATIFTRCCLHWFWFLEFPCGFVSYCLLKQALPVSMWETMCLILYQLR